MTSSTPLSQLLLEVVPPLMHQIRTEVRIAARKSLSIPQYRILAHIHRGIRQVGQMAERHGVSQPAMSKMVEGLVRRKWVERVPHPSDRRQILLQMTPLGLTQFQRVRKKTQNQLAVRLQSISRADQKKMEQALSEIGSILSKQSSGNQETKIKK